MLVEKVHSISQKCGQQTGYNAENDEQGSIEATPEQPGQHPDGEGQHDTGLQKLTPCDFQGLFIGFYLTGLSG
jgi:hypothetical protein